MLDNIEKAALKLYIYNAHIDAGLSESYVLDVLKERFENPLYTMWNNLWKNTWLEKKGNKPERRIINC